MLPYVLAARINGGGRRRFLRANTAMTRMMTTYTRRGAGQQYLKTVLAPLVRRCRAAHRTSASQIQSLLASDHHPLEVDPVKVACDDAASHH